MEVKLGVMKRLGVLLVGYDAGQIFVKSDRNFKADCRNFPGRQRCIRMCRYDANPRHYYFCRSSLCSYISKFTGATDVEESAENREPVELTEAKTVLEAP